MQIKSQTKRCHRCREPSDTIFILPHNARFRDEVCWECLEEYKKQYKRFVADFMDGTERQSPFFRRAK